MESPQWKPTEQEREVMEAVWMQGILPSQWVTVSKFPTGPTTAPMQRSMPLMPRQI